MQDLKARAAQVAAMQDTQQVERKPILFIGTPDDMEHDRTLKSLLIGYNVLTYTKPVDSLQQILHACKTRGISAILTTSAQFISLLAKKPRVNLDDYAGSVLYLEDIKVVCLNPLEHFNTVPHGKHLAARYISKITKPQNWFKQSDFSWEVATPATLPAIYERFRKDAWLIAVDIETLRDGLQIDIAGYCAIFHDGTTHSITISICDEDSLLWAKKFNELPQDKIFQNGNYDNTYFLRWGIPPVAYFWDTLHMFHSWYAELPKSLDFITSYLLPDFIYWKDEKGNNRADDYLYNAKDTWATANCFLALMAEMPAWAKKNYTMEFPIVFPCIQCGLEGFKIDEGKRKEIEKVETIKLNAELQSLQESIGNPSFNPSSPKQVLQLLHILGHTDAKSSDSKTLEKLKTTHPLTAFFIEAITTYRKARKLLTGYVESELLAGRFLYALSPAGTTTGRLASKASNFWVGSQIQNIPPSAKSMFVADDGWLLAELDKSQAEDRCVATLSGEPALLHIFSSGQDSHSFKGSMFFGIPMEEIIAQEKAKKRGEFKGMSLRDLAKRINHGANYNMGAGVLLQTMGIAAVAKARNLLGLPATLPLHNVCQHLLGIYEKTFPAVKGRWYSRIKADIAATKMLIGATGWTRYCFGDPIASKQQLNAYVAHSPQSLSVMIVNKEFYAIWLWALDNPQHIRIKAQVHDSIVFQYKEDWVVDKVMSLMQTTVQVTGSDGVVRDLYIPTDSKKGGKSWGG
jgi:hypothetical protein